MLEYLKIVCLGVAAAVAYGILHDQVTARLCVEYFTVFHAPVLDTQSPTVLALVWGVLGTWWVGLPAGATVAVFARWGRRPKLPARRLLGPLAVLLVLMGLLSLVAGVAVFVLARLEVITVWEPWASRISVDKHHAFMAALWAHRTAYIVGYLGTVVLWGWCAYQRNLPATAKARPSKADA